MWEFFDILINQFKLTKLLTQTKICFCPVAVQLGFQFLILAVNFNSFRVEVDGVVEIILSVTVITLIFVNLCYG